MGKLVYDGNTEAHFDDRVLAHLHLVITAKLRRGESFLFTWDEDPSAAEAGRTAIWIHPHASVSFKFYGNRTASTNRAWVEQLMLAANSPQGLRVLPEPPDHEPEPGKH